MSLCRCKDIKDTDIQDLRIMRGANVKVPAFQMITQTGIRNMNIFAFWRGSE